LWHDSREIALWNWGQLKDSNSYEELEKRQTTESTSSTASNIRGSFSTLGHHWNLPFPLDYDAHHLTTKIPPHVLPSMII
jgi:hypothetical protein